jgi:hypothetical protein
MTGTKRLRLAPILITLAASLILSIGSFYGCSRTFMNGRANHLNLLFFYSFLVCALACAGSMIWLLVTIVLNFVRRSREGQ